MIDPRLTRRDVLRTGSALLALGALPGLPRRVTAGTPPASPFTLGVASGEPTARSVVLWTRLAPDPLAGGGMGPDPVPVRWEVATDPTMTNVVRTGRATADPRFGHSVHAYARGLEPDRWYWYRFDTGGVASPVGRTRTFPRPGADADRLRFALASCQNYEAGFYAAWARMAEEDLDFVVHAGDYIYEGGVSGSAVRSHDGPEIQTIADYRNRYALYKLDPALQAAHAAFPVLVTWDDHEVDNNYAGDFPEDGTPTDAFLARRAIAYQAHWEHMPFPRRRRPRGADTRLYRHLRFGTLAQIHMLDTRQFRTDQCPGPGGPPCPQSLDPSSEILGPAQERWLFRQLARSRATWNVLGQAVMMMQWNISGNPASKIVNYDQWDGYSAARQRLLDVLADERPANPIVLAGDIHSSWAGDLLRDFDDPGSEILGSEFVGTSISSSLPAIVNTLAQSSLPGNPHIKYFDGERRGYVRFDVDRTRWRADYRLIDDVLDPDSPVQTAASFVVEAGLPGVTAA